MRIFWATFPLVLALLSGCAPDVSPDSYGVGSVGNVNRAVRGHVVSVRVVNINGTSGTGALAGGAAGAAAGSALGGSGSTRTNIVGAIGGAVAGSVIGGAVEAGATKQTGYEYVVETQNGALLTIVQSDDTPLAEGTNVIVLYGARSRLIADTPRQ